MSKTYEYKFAVYRPDGSSVIGRFVGNRPMSDQELAKAIAEELSE